MSEIRAGGAGPRSGASRFLEELFPEEPLATSRDPAPPPHEEQTSLPAQDPEPQPMRGADVADAKELGREEEYFDLDPASILEEGPYIRQHIDEDALEALAQDLTQEQGIEQAIGVREVRRESGKVVYALVYGRRRLLAARGAGLPRIRVRNYGRISIRESLALQARENEQRQATHAVDTAVSYQMMIMLGQFTQAEISRIVGKEPSYISYMRAVGEAILCLSPLEREQLYQHPDASVATFQELARVHPIEDRITALRRILDPEGVPDGTPPTRRRRPYGGSATRRGDGYSFRYLVADAELRANPDAALQAVEQFCEAQLTTLRHRAAELRRRDAPTEADRPPAPASEENEGEIAGHDSYVT